MKRIPVPSESFFFTKALFLFLFITTLNFRANAQCGCTFTIPAGSGSTTFNGTAQGVKPGDVICIQAGARERIIFQNIVGSATNYVTIKNCGGQALIGGPNAGNGILINSSRYFRITGTGDAGVEYGIKIIETKSGTQGIVATSLSSDIEIDHIEITKTGFAGIMAKTDPSSNCADKAPERPNFTMRNIHLHHNYIHDIGGEGFYIGNSFYTGTTIYCGSTQYPHEVRGVRIHDNLVMNSGWESIQVGAAVADVEIYNNKVYNYGSANNPSQNGGIQMGIGTTGKLYNNFIKGGFGPCLVIQGIGLNYVFNNVIVNPGAEAININTRPTPLASDIVPIGYLGGVYVINNTIVNATTAAIKENINTALGNVLFNNLIVASTTNWNQLKTYTDWTQGNNVVIPVLANAKFVNPTLDDYRIQSGSPAINAGRNVALWGVTFDFDKLLRPTGANWDAGAFELSGNQKPVVNVGLNQTLILPINTTTIIGAASDADGSIASYQWTKTSGPAATMTNATLPVLLLTDLVQGTYVFRLTATDNAGETGYAEVTITVQAAAVNQPPVANAGGDKTITLPVSTTTINGSASDNDGTVTTYAWTQVSGTTATLVNAGTATLTVNGMTTAGTYVFRLTATDDDGATDTDDVSVVVQPAAVNKPPVVNAGTDKNLTLPTNAVNLVATASDPDGSIATYTWTKVSGPAATTTGINTATLSLSNLVVGSYVFRLTVTDNASATAFDEVSVVVNAANTAPVVNAGTDKTIKLPTNTVTLPGSASDDGTITSYLWTKVSGPAAILTNQTTTTLTVTNMLQGTYTFRLTATDNNSASASDEVVVIVQAANVAPVANAGTDKTLTLPVNSTTLTGSGTDSDGSIATYFWEKLSGPAATLGATNQTTLDLTNLVEGSYSFRLRVTDNEGATGTDVVAVVVLPLTVNQPPIVSAGNDVTLTLPVNSTTLTGTASDNDGSITAYLWEKVSGPTATLSGTSTATLSASSLLEGVYIFRLTVTDNKSATASDEVRVTVTSVNQNPIVNAGIDKTLILPTNLTSLTATASDPDGTIATHAWSQQSGPSVATLSGASTATVDISGLIIGTYVFRVTVTDNDGGQSFDDAKVIVQAASNVNPVANAGNNVVLFLPTNTAILTGSGTDSDGTITGYQWVKVSGGVVTMANETTSILTISALTAGTYVFRLTVTDDDGATGIDEVTVTVNPSSSNQSPIADAGPNITLSLPVNSTNLIGSGTDPDGTIASYSWVKISGPSAFMINTTSPVLSLTDLVEGVYIFRLTVTDDDGATATDNAQVIVLPATVNQTPSVTAGNNITVTLPTNSLTLTAFASDPDGSIASYIWAKQVGPAATLSGETTASLLMEDLQEGTYTFRVTVADNAGSTAFDEVNVIVLPEGSNQPPLVNAGSDKTLFLPTNSLNLSGTASDNDGSITTYEWIKIQGPSVTESNTNSPTASLTNLVAGQYTFRLTATDDDGASAFDEVNITVFPGTINQSPIANAGSNQSLVLPNSTATITGSGFDPDGSIVSYAWTQVLGASSVLENINSPTLIVNNLTEGVYRYQLTVEDDDGASGSDFVDITVVAEGTNLPPIANAGFDQVIYLPQTTADLQGSGDDIDGTIQSYLWEKKSGGVATLSGQATSKLSLSGLAVGSYQFTLTVTDNGNLTNVDEVNVSVLPGSINKNPIVSAGNDLFFRAPIASFPITATASDPDGSISFYNWTKVSGPAISPPAGVTTPVLTISNPPEGTYVFRIDVTDNGGSTASDEVTVVIAPPGTNSPPVVTTGNSFIVFKPASTATINGSAFDLDGAIASLVWTQEAGPSTTSLSGANSTTLNVAGLDLGSYTFRLTAVDNESAEAFSEIVIEVRAENLPPTAFAGNDTTLYLPDNFIALTGTGDDPDGTIADLTWQQLSGPPANVNLDNNPIISISDLIEGVYLLKLTVTDNAGATASDEITITVLEDPVNPIGAAKLFSPNGDLTNDTWVVKNITMIDSCPIKIFNRLGKKVFEANVYENNWDAVLNGRPLEEGDYYYVIQCSSNKKYSGAIRLIR
ncbi:gliding motility-associated C-terminal domain-containing protein [Ohtaekwangia koreensis]|uniref:Gliding motility-associated C-terminal domain-containing protein n=1 Tax=Ohtaekwangia koreensis TaxID=688867 RepID=A0A1T5M2L0_9BACT|nr:gliding motility-associated C-terminal domain-containing protein [Ohtaekwangia koreensis]SKC82426.1 gliding motility-associated C-terminal domain-containing protein [Ohtaekwangia koreensis]